MSTRPPPPTGPPPYTMINRMYKSSLRPVVVTISLITAGWALVWAIGAFQDINVDKDHQKPRFATLDIVLGSLYIAACVFELFGATAAIMQTLALIRIYSWLSVVSALAVIAAGFMRTITHFIFKNDLISECQQIAQGQDVTFRFGIWGPVVHDKLSPEDAESFCKSAWSHDSFSEIISLLIELVLAGFFIAIAFAYYHQCLDPASPANAARAARAPSAQFRNQEFPDHYNPPYVAYDAPAPSYAPPPGPPPQFKEPPMYGADDATLKGDDPFADFDGPAHKKVGESRDSLV